MISEPVLSAAELTAFLNEEFEQVAADYEVLDVGPMSARIGMTPGGRHLRPGGTVSGPTMFSLADCAVYLAIIAHVGREALAVTTNASIDFLRKPAPGVPLEAAVELVKLGRVLAVGEVKLWSGDALVARACLTYSRPPKQAG